ncbi:hypothetical protein LINPERHAP1_LOCUS17785 [Linum perenne]
MLMLKLRRCPLCMSVDETRDHLFGSCAFIQRLKAKLLPECNGLLSWSLFLDEAISWRGNGQVNCIKRLKWIMIVNSVWRSRCATLYGDKKVSEDDCIAQIELDLISFAKGRKDENRFLRCI